MPPRKKSNKSGIIAAVQTPLGLCALIVLVIEGILGGMALRVKETHLTILLVGMITGLLIIAIAAAISVMRKPESLAAQLSAGPPADEPEQIPLKYDVFLSSPMAAVSNADEYQTCRDEALQVAEALRRECGLKNIFYAGRHIDSAIDFDVADISVKDDLKAIAESRYFVMIYKSKVASSSLFEAGCAMALGKPSLYFVRDKKHLPFLLKQAEQAFSLVKIYEHEDLSDLTRKISKHKMQLFPLATN